MSSAMVSNLAAHIAQEQSYLTSNSCVVGALSAGPSRYPFFTSLDLCLASQSSLCSWTSASGCMREWHTTSPKLPGMHMLALVM